MNPLRVLSNICRELSRFSSVFLRFAIGVGLYAGPLLSSGPAAPANRPRTEGRTVQTDSEPTPKTPSADGIDLPLNPEGERKAKALSAFSEGLIAEEDGDAERAFQAYKHSLAFDPNNPELASKVAFEMARRGDVAEGINLLKDAAKAAPKEMLLPLCLSQIYSKFLKKPALAIKNANLALELDPDNISPYLALVELYTDAGQPKKAGAILERALQSESTDADFWVQLGELCARLDLKGDGTASPEKLRRINALFQKALGCDPEDLDVMEKAADFYFESKQFEVAAPLFRKVIAAADEPDSDDTLALRDKLARSLMDSGHRDQALDVLQKMAAAAPNRVETQALIGDIHLLEGRMDAALNAYREVIRLDPSIAPAYLRVADLQMRLGQSDQAIATLTAARKQFPGAALVTYSLAATLAQARQYAQSLSLFEETLREAPASKPDLINASFYLAYGMAAEQSGDLERAATLLKKSIALDSKASAQASNYLGYMWVDRGVHLPEAGELIQRAVSLEPKNGAYLDSLGWYYYRVADYPKAIESLLKAVALLPDPDPVVFEHLGDAYNASGDHAKALEAWNKALALDSGNKGLATKIQKAQSVP